MYKSKPKLKSKIKTEPQNNFSDFYWKLVDKFWELTYFYWFPDSSLEWQFSLRYVFDFIDKQSGKLFNYSDHYGSNRDQVSSENLF